MGPHGRVGGSAGLAGACGPMGPGTWAHENFIAYDVDNEKAVLSRREVSQYEC